MKNDECPIKYNKEYFIHVLVACLFYHYDDSGDYGYNSYRYIL